MAISSRQAGSIVACPTCGEPTQVPLEDQFLQRSSLEASDDESQADSRDSNAGTISRFSESVPKQSELVQRVQEEVDVAPNEDAANSQNARSDEDDFVPQEIGDDEDGNGEAPLTFRRHRNIDEEMDLTPMVDVTFQLLIFFMVSASFSLQKSIEVPTPDPEQKGASQQVQTLDDLQGTSIIVKIDSANTIFIDEDPLNDLSRLADTLRDKMRREQKTELLVTADNQSLHRTVIAVIDAANEVGMQKIRMTSRKKVD